MSDFPPNRRHARQGLVLKVEFDDPEGFRSNYLSDLSQGGLRLNTALPIGHRFTLNISFLGFVEPVQIEAEVQWSLPPTHPEGPAAGLAFVDASPDALAWLYDILDSSTQVFINKAQSSRVALLEPEPFLREVYGQEVRNWAELRGEAPIELVTHDNSTAWFDEVTCDSAAVLGIIDMDEIADAALSLYRRVRHHSVSAELPLIIIGSAKNIELFSGVTDDLLFCLRKPLKFGLLMNTVRVLAMDM